MIRLILGGARSGKSALAEAMACRSEGKVHYLATAQVWDSEMADRVQHHRVRRPEDWALTEEPLDIIPVLRQNTSETSQCLLVDCLTLWLTNVLLLDDPDELVTRQAMLIDFLTEGVEGELILVSNEVGQGIVPDNALARKFVDEAGRLHQKIAMVADQVVFVTAGLPQVLKGPALD